MSRSGYIEEIDDYEGELRARMWRGAVLSALRGKRGQAFLRELLAALDAMPVKELVAGALEEDGQHCALGVVGQARGKQLASIDTDDWEQLACEFGIAEAMAREVMYENDACVSGVTWIDFEVCGPIRPNYPDWGRHRRTIAVPDPLADEKRWHHMRAWVLQHIKDEA